MAGPLVLVVIDGFGIAPPGPGNAISLARTPNLDALAREGSASRLHAAGLPVGLPDGQMGNSEVGHLNLGAGRRVPQMLVRIDEAIADGSFATLPAVRIALQAARGRTLHLVGLLGDGGVHASQRHLDALIAAARAADVDVAVHALTDGRDSRPDAALGFVQALEGAGVRVASVCGRYWAMDRDNRWERTKRAYYVIVHGAGEQAASATAAVRASYERGVTDEFIEPFVIGDPSRGRVRDGDAVLYWNFRPDRARQLTQALGDPVFAGFDRGGAAPSPVMVTMTRYRAEWDYPVAFESQDVRAGLAEHISALGLPQLHVAETEKYAHVTYFFNGGREAPFEGEERILVQSPQHVATYDHAPAMSADGIRAAVVEHLGAPRPPAFVVVNFANADMVGHTGVVAAAVAGIEAVDTCMADIRLAVAAAGGLLAVTADHGNSEHMIEPDGSPNTAHTTNPVPLWIDRAGLPLMDGKLGDVAPTLCALHGWDQSQAMTGEVLV